MKKITKKLLSHHNLTEEEYQKILVILNREPNLLELGIFSVMWSEHCSYKSTKKWLKTLPTRAPWVICGPGENAGVIDIGDDDALVFKMESHNHPSFIEPYQGAATGVGGIMRDVFTMGARPIANLNSLRFGEPKNPKTNYLVNGVVSGIGDYGNCVGIPTVGGECFFHECYNNNILVNAMSVGLVKKNKIFYSAAKGKSFPIIYVGAKTGRDGIHGATMASAEFDDYSSENRPQVQVGDPFTEKLLLEACLELMNTKAIVSIQDMGAAGLTSSSFEMASKGNKGIDLNIDKIPLREKGMTPYEIMLSETQERMLMVINPEYKKITSEIFNKWGLESVEVGNLNDTQQMKIFSKNKIQCNLPINDLVKNSPEYDRNSKKKRISVKHSPKKKDIPIKESFKKIISNENFSNKRPLFSQYDFQVMADTVLGPQESDSAVIRIHNTNKAVALTSDCNPIYCKANPYRGAMIAVAESWRNLCAVGAKPMAITDNLNFGNPEKNEIMHEIKESIRGIGDACSLLNFPVVSGNVSLYNETNGESIYPTPVIGGVGLLKNYKKKATINLEENGKIFVIGKTYGHLDLSMYKKIVFNEELGQPPNLDLIQEKKNGDFIRNYIDKFNHELIGVHDISEGGIIVSLAEMVIKCNIGVKIKIPKKKNKKNWLFGEDQSRYVVVVREKNSIENEALHADVFIENIGVVKGNGLKIEKLFEISNKELININSKFFMDCFN